MGAQRLADDPFPPPPLPALRSAPAEELSLRCLLLGNTLSGRHHFVLPAIFTRRMGGCSADTAASRSRTPALPCSAAALVDK